MSEDRDLKEVGWLGLSHSVRLDALFSLLVEQARADTVTAQTQPTS